MLERFRDELVFEIASIARADVAVDGVDPAAFLPSTYRDLDELDGFLEHLAGEVSDSGGADIRLHTDDADGARMADMTLAGALRNGHLYASGTIEREHRITRTVTLDWQRQ